MLPSLNTLLHTRTRLLDCNLDRDRPILRLQYNQVVIIRNILSRRIHQPRSRNDLKRHEGRHNIQLAVSQTISSLALLRKSLVVKTHFSPIHVLVPLPKAINFFCNE
jgi:hypothetical protein